MDPNLALMSVAVVAALVTGFVAGFVLGGLHARLIPMPRPWPPPPVLRRDGGFASSTSRPPGPRPKAPPPPLPPPTGSPRPSCPAGWTLPEWRREREACRDGHSYAPWSSGDDANPCARCGHVPGREPCGHKHGRYGCTADRCGYGREIRPRPPHLWDEMMADPQVREAYDAIVEEEG